MSARCHALASTRPRASLPSVKLRCSGAHHPSRVMNCCSPLWYCMVMEEVDRLAIACYLGGKDVFNQAIADFSAAYADKNERDFGLLEEDATAGRISVERGL